MTAAALPRRLGTIAVASTLVGIVIGSGIYQVPAAVAGYVPDPQLFMLVWLVGGLLAMSGALMFAELAAMFPHTGGRYVYLREGIHPVVAFTYAVGQILLLRPVSLGLRALLLAGYMAVLVPTTVGHESWVAAGVIVLLALVNIRSTVGGANLTVLITVLKVFMLSALAGLLLTLGATGMESSAETVIEPAVSWKGFGLAMLAVMYTYSGWGSTTYLTGELREAEREMPRVLIGGLGFVVLLFLVVNLGYLNALPIPILAQSNTVAADAATSVAGSLGAKLVSALVVLSVFGSLAGTMLTAPRLPFALGVDSPRIGWLAKVHSAYATPHLSIIFGGTLAIAFLWNRTFEGMVEAYILGSWPFYVLCAVGFFRLRSKRPDHPRPFRVPWYPIVPGFFLLVAGAMVANGLAADWKRALLGTWVMFVGVPLYYLIRPKAGTERG